MMNEAPMLLNGSTQPFFDDPFQDRLLAMIMSLAAEVAALREELSNVRGALEDKALLSAEEVDGYLPAAAAQALRDRARETLVANLLFPLQQACDTLSAAQTRKAGTP